MIILRTFLLFVIYTLSLSARAELNIEITRGSDAALPISIVPFANNSGQPVPEDVSKVVANDLQRSGDFEVLPTSKMLSLPNSSAQIHYRDWRLLGQNYVLVGEIEVDSAKRVYKVTYELVDIYQQKRLIGEVLSSSGTGLRKLAHRISDNVYEAITGVEGAFSTRIAYVTQKRLTKDKSEYRLQVADADGQNSFTLFKSNDPILSPAWSNDAQHLAYVSFHSGRPAIYVQHIKSAQQRKVTGFKGINSSPMWSPDDRKLVMTLSKDGNAELYSMDLATNALQRLTNHYGIDTEASWSPDGRDVVFTSNRGGGSPQIYRMSLSDLRPERISFEGRYNARPRYSRDGKSVYYVHQVNGQFHIAELDLSSLTTRVLTSTPLDESPSLSPNGRMIIYSTKLRNRSVLAVVSVDGGAKYFLPSEHGDVKEPSWSPFLN
ncbi:MAG: Tol-Pal system protein TolB [Oleiphilus sp.]|nr:MAG: Tol-Pal system protein TolB [Oleiphilus sp.]